MPSSSLATPHLEVRYWTEDLSIILITVVQRKATPGASSDPRIEPETYPSVGGPAHH